MDIIRKITKGMDALQIIFVASLSLFILGMIGLLLTSDVSNTHKYYRSAIVTDVKGKEVYLEDTTHNVWCVEDDSLQMYGRYILTMDSMGTETIFDDEVVEVK